MSTVMRPTPAHVIFGRRPIGEVRQASAGDARLEPISLAFQTAPPDSAHADGFRQRISDPG
jgi:hypothetical protein